MDAQTPDPRRKRVVIGENRAAVAIAAKRLGREETRRGRGRERAELPAPIGRAECLRGIVENGEAVLGRNCGDRVVVRGQAEQIDRDHGTRLKAAPLRGCDGAAQTFGIEIEGLGFDIRHHRSRAEQRHHLGRGAEGEGRADHSIAGPDLPSHQHEQQRVGAARATDDVPRAAECRKIGFERADFRALDELAVFQNTRNRIVDHAAKPAPLRRDVDERN